jgi:hypothetical protein
MYPKFFGPALTEQPECFLWHSRRTSTFQRMAQDAIENGIQALYEALMQKLVS